jgi:transcriptional regulator with XRE-family HTH domain
MVHAMTDERERPPWAERLQAEREGRGWSKAEMGRRLRRAIGAEHTPVDSLTRQIRDWEKGKHFPRDWAAAYAIAFRLDESELFSEQGEVAPMRPSPGPVSAGAGDAEVIRNMLNALTASDRQFGGTHARQYATDYLSTVIQPRLHSHADERLLRRLFAVSTEFTLRVSAMHLDTGHARTSLRLLGTASSMAQETNDLTLTAWVLSRRGEHEIHQAMLARYRGAEPSHAKHTERALAYTSGAAAMARQSSPQARAFILTKQALAGSMTGDHAQTQRILGEVWDAYDKAGGAEEPDWMRMYGWGHLRHEEARCYYNLGMGEEAVRAAEESMKVRTDPRPRAFTLGIQAIGYTQTKPKDLDRACAAAHEVIELIGQVTSDRVRIRLGEVLDALRPYQETAAVRDVFDAAQPVMTGFPK